jgi:hypothetical protein
MFEDFLLYCDTSLQVWGYLLVLNLYVYNAKEVFKYTIFYISITQNEYVLKFLEE